MLELSLMPRKVIPLVTRETYHIYNRGVDKRAVFLDKLDFFRFHKSLQIFNAKEQSGSVYRRNFNVDWINQQRPLVDINAYCLLGNHYHLILTQNIDGGISEFMKRLGGGYTSYFNERHDRSGALFQGNYKRVHCKNNKQLLYLAAYVNYNNLVHDAKSYCLNSQGAYSGERRENFVKTYLILNQYESAEKFTSEAVATVRQIAQKRKADKEFDIATLLE